MRALMGRHAHIDQPQPSQLVSKADDAKANHRFALDNSRIDVLRFHQRRSKDHRDKLANL